MRAKLLGVVVGVLGVGGPAAAQYQGGYGQGGYGYGQPGFGSGGYAPSPYAQFPQVNPANVMPNVYNPQYQPLSPYLNLARGGNPAVNYYYGVRPGTVGGAGGIGGAPMVAMGGNRAPFFPQLASGPDPFAPIGASPTAVLPPAGHQVVYGNTLGYFPGTFGRGMRTGLYGAGNRFGGGGGMGSGMGSGTGSGSMPRR